MAKRRFEDAEVAEFYDLVTQSFERDTFDQFLKLRLGRSLSGIAPNQAFDLQLLEVIRRANQEYWHYQLLDALTVARADDPDIAGFAARFRVGTRLADATDSLEKLALHSRIHDLTWVVKAMEQAARRVCRVENQYDEALGTGFLVAPDLVLTNFHVLESLIPDVVSPERLQFRFDFKTNLVGETIADGTIQKPQPNGALQAWKPYHENDLKETPLSKEWPDDALDFALVRLAEPVGELPAGPHAGQPGPGQLPGRGWFEVSDAPDLTPGKHAIILQHPKGAPISIARGFIDDPAVNHNGTRVRYTVSTLKGSSGSPCLDAAWQLIALHHSSDPAGGDWGKFNQGIPIRSILDSLGVDSFQDVN